MKIKIRWLLREYPPSPNTGEIFGKTVKVLQFFDFDTLEWVDVPVETE